MVGRSLYSIRDRVKRGMPLKEGLVSEFAARHIARTKAMHADPEFAARNVVWMKALHADPEFAAKRDAGKAGATAVGPCRLDL